MMQQPRLDAAAQWKFAHAHMTELRMPYGFAASDVTTGIYNALFGRDSLWMLTFLLETLHLRPSQELSDWIEQAGVDILWNLASSQGTQINDATEEQPGKIVHEARQVIDERLQQMGLAFDERGRYFGGFDQTFLFVSVYRRFAETFPTNSVITQTWPNVERALQWIDTYADADGDGFFEYERHNPSSLPNQVWKDSFDSIIQSGVDVPPSPIAWIEVQGYAVRTFEDAAALYRQRGDNARADSYQQRAATLKAAIPQAFWLTNESCFAIGLAANKSQIAMVSSNAAHLLWAGAVEPEQARVLAQRLMQPDMTSSYGMRTLSAQSPFYDAFAYHRGCIWPFDNGIAVMGLLKYGFTDEAMKIVRGVSNALTLLGSPIELYIALDAAIFVQPQLPPGEVLTLRCAGQENRNQGWTAATMLYFAALLLQA